MLSEEDGLTGQQQPAQGSALGVILSPMGALQEAKELIIFIWENAFALLGR
ncbi:MAG: hypothetical protein IKH22_04985 [Prevotella sp.]|nr:hypothetical protein [Prevotella sp.]